MAGAGGDGFVSFTPTASGTLTFAVTLQDGTALAIPTFLTDAGKAWIIAWPHGYRGILAGELSLSSGTAPDYLDNSATGTLHWRRPPSTIVPAVPLDNTAYLDGIAPALTIKGARYLPPNTLFNGRKTSPFVVNSLRGHLLVELTDGDLTDALSTSSPAAVNSSGVATFTPYRGGELRLTSLAFNPATGRFSGTSTEYADYRDWPAVLSGPFQGIITRDDPTLPDAYGTGCFIRSFVDPIYDTGDPNHPKLIQRLPMMISGAVRIYSEP